ncbi:hypothetical protein DAMNIGENAA_01240 [Desulforhabdus amnigena]|uniref:Uncharacterized protein n=1 Tax=Desulforhabdus amnigena TaxID=40218 RepID=A0A9W6FT96_9BACT|nr:hypothetical protein DAMNIGENAA_01240 [Desulforhabdus amnigena]
MNGSETQDGLSLGCGVQDIPKPTYKPRRKKAVKSTLLEKGLQQGNGQLESSFHVAEKFRSYG